MAHHVTQQEGLLIGGSGGTAIAAACELAKDLTEDDLVVVVIPDSGRGYLSTVFNDQWMSTMGFSSGNEEGLTVADLLEKKDADLQGLIYLQPTQSAQEALALMEKHDISQVPVAKGEMPIAAAEVLGSISKSWILAQPNTQDELLDTPIGKIIEPALPAVGLGTSVDLVIEIFHESSALLVFDGGRPKTVITRADIGEHPSTEGA